MLSPRLLLYAALVLAVLDLLKREDAAPALPLVKADFPACVTVKNEPILRAPRDRLDYVPGVPFNDLGVS